jgi:hypothetical protein
VFIAKEVPALGSRIYQISQQSTVNNHPSNRSIVQSLNRSIDQSGNFITGNFSLKIDPETGAIRSLEWLGEELVDTSRYAGLNQYLYVEGRFPDDPIPASVKNISVTDDGPIVKTIRIEYGAPGCNKLAADAQIVDELNMIRIINHIDKKKVYDPEAVHLAFPFNKPGGQIRYDLAYGHCEPEKDQLPGSNKNFLCMEHWLDVSNEESGITLICPDAPLFEVGELTMDAIVTGWRDSIPSSQTVISYLMNNYWETNYAAAQEGLGRYSYILIPHGKFNPVATEKAAIEARQSLIARRAGSFQKAKPSLLKINNTSLIITSTKPMNEGNELLISIYNAGDETEILDMEHAFQEVYPSNVDGNGRKPVLEDYRIPPQGSLFLKFVK